jgi:hypothetical protein
MRRGRVTSEVKLDSLGFLDILDYEACPSCHEMLAKWVKLKGHLLNENLREAHISVKSVNHKRLLELEVLGKISISKIGCMLQLLEHQRPLAESSSWLLRPARRRPIEHTASTDSHTTTVWQGTGRQEMVSLAKPKLHVGAATLYSTAHYAKRDALVAYGR